MGMGCTIFCTWRRAGPATSGWPAAWAIRCAGSSGGKGLKGSGGTQEVPQKDDAGLPFRNAGAVGGLRRDGWSGDEG